MVENFSVSKEVYRGSADTVVIVSSVHKDGVWSGKFLAKRLNIRVGAKPLYKGTLLSMSESR